ncbi:MAG: IS481 family transposase [Proteobacteria bacterium]|nr:IS481 family transposase [Pseudomonadota bacterium]
MDLRIEFMKRVMKGETVAELCREFGISRKTGDKFKQRFKELGEAGLLDQSRAPKVIPHKTAPEVVKLLIDEKKRHPSWGPKKIKTQLEDRLLTELPAVSTIGDILERAGLVTKRGRRHAVQPHPTTLREALAPNDVWCIDYKGQFRLGNRSLCYPLTLTDQRTRFILGCDAMPAISDEEARESCGEIFRRYGLPKAMRSDNGVPFASTGLANLTKLSAYWLQLGIELERIRPAHPEENGQHERMHRTLKFETTRPPRTNLLQQQERFDEFVEEFNTERPHEALGMKRPAQVYKVSPRKMPPVVPELEYPQHDDVLRVDRVGYISHRRRRCYLSTALAYQTIGLREELDGRWLVTFAKLDLGHVDITGFNPL